MRRKERGSLTHLTAPKVLPLGRRKRRYPGLPLSPQPETSASSVERLGPKGKSQPSGRGVEGVTLSIPDRKQPHEAPIEAEERYRRIFEGSKDMIYITSVDGKILDVNQAGVDLLGYESKEEMMQVYARDTFLYHEEQKRFMNAVMKEGFVKDFEVKQKRKDGTSIDVLITANVRRDDSGKIIGYDGIIKDISDRRRMEEELVQRTRELRP